MKEEIQCCFEANRNTSRREGGRSEEAEIIQQRISSQQEDLWSLSCCLGTRFLSSE